MKVSDLVVSVGPSILPFMLHARHDAHGHDAHVGELLQHIRRLPIVDQNRAWKLVSKVMLAVDTAIDAETITFPSDIR